MKITEAIVLAGGLGTRLRSVVSELPKCMAPVAGRPFLDYVINYFRKQGIEKFIFALGFKSEMIESFLETKLAGLEFQVSLEDQPLGTGGAIMAACKKSSSENVLVLNGDTFFSIHFEELALLHFSRKADCTLSLKPMQRFDRYGTVELREDHSVRKFSEKRWHEEGLINGGVYALNAANFLREDLAEKFSFEQNYLENFVDSRRMFGIIQDEYFIDIGIPADYERAQTEMKELI
jgi:D-glycero-alpha-D-manno-heptose 1-phosphate guanylyltransferase